MSSYKLTFLCLPVLMLASCATPGSVQNEYAKIPKLNEQCEVLSKKREPLRIKGKRLSKKINRNNFARIQSQSVPFQKTSQHAILFVDSLTPVNLIPKFNPDELGMSNTQKSVLTINFKPISKINSLTQPTQVYNKPQREIPESHSDSTVIQPEKYDQAGSKSNLIPIVIGSGMLTMLLLGMAGKQSKKISLWASKNPWKTRGILASAHLIATVSALSIGFHLSTDGVVISEGAKYLALSAILASVCLYPSLSATNYFQRKVYDSVLITSGMVMMVYAGNNYTIKPSPSVNTVYSIANHTTENLWHVVKRDIPNTKIQEKEQEPPKKRSTAGKIILTILAVGALAGLGYLLAALSCQIACSGSEALAAVVAIGGGLGLVIGFIAVIKSIFGKRKRKQKKPELETHTL